jgi:CTP:molybdopterin cytidylyltransferase MocA
VITGLVLAAGAGRRLGQPKAEVVVAGQRLLDRAVQLLLDGGCDEVVAVVRTSTVAAEPARCVVNPDADSGMGSSLRTGLDFLAGDGRSAAAVIVLVDQVGIAPSDIATIIATFRADGGVTVARRGGRRSHPVLIPRSRYAEVIATASGDSGARVFLDAQLDLTFVDLPDIVADIDTPADLDAARSRLTAAPPIEI